MGKVWVIADTHFCHINVITYCNRPFNSVEEMDETLINNWNRVVAPDDVVYHLGDFALADRERIRNIVSRLNGVKILVMGNHDRFQPAFYISAGFKTAIHKSIIIDNNLVLSHIPPAREYISDKYIYIFGHIHDKHIDIEDLPNCLCVCCDRTDFFPISLKRCKDLIKRKKGE